MAAIAVSARAEAQSVVRPPEVQPPAAGEKASKEWQLYRLGRICQYISSKSKVTTSDSLNTYNYQEIVHEAAEVDLINDSDEEIVAKVAALWKREKVNDIRCGPMGVPATGSPLRFAIHTSFDEFITDWISLWKLDLNEIENGQTTLDFLDDRIARSVGLAKENLERYRKAVIRAGGKRRSELPQ